MSFIVKGNTVDISDYVVDASKIAVLQRNRNWSLVLSEIDLTVSGKANSAAIFPGAEITIASSSNNNYPFYIGIISEKKYDYETQRYHLQIRSVLTKLEKYTVSYDTLHSLLIAGATAQQYRAVDNAGYPSVQFTWILEKMFELVGIELKLPSSSTLIEDIVYVGISRRIELQHLRIDENMLYCINQYVATHHNNIDKDPEKLLLVPTFLDFLQWFTSSIGPVASANIGWNVRWSGSATPKQLSFFVRNDDEITPGDDVIYALEDGNIVGDDEGYAFNVQFRKRDKYLSVAEYALVAHTYRSGLGKTNIEYPTNLCIMYERFWTAPGDTLAFFENLNHGSLVIGDNYYIDTYNAPDDFVSVGAIKNAAGEQFMATGTTPSWSAGSNLTHYFAYAYPPWSFLKNKIDEIAADLTTKKMITNATYTTAKESYIDLDRQSTEIVQEF